MTVASDAAVEVGQDSFGRVFDQLFFLESSQRERGTAFERMLKRYLQLEPKYADRFSDVWLWQDWPGRDGRVDTGVDLVAQDRYTGEYVAIQAKFYDPERTLQKQHIDSFFTELGHEEFSEGMIVSTTDKWSKHAEAALDSQSKQVQRVRLQDFAGSTIDWSQFDLSTPEKMVKGPGKHPRKYQREAIDDVRAGFETHDRGRLIMACGTGKTFTSLKLVEEHVPAGGSVLFLVPSIALLQQSLNEWTAQADVPLRPFAVCSDTSVGRRKDDEDVAVHDLGFPATTDPAKLAARFSISTGQDAVSVVFSTYQSIDVIHQAQQQGMPEFDLVICDEAHRTTGISQPGADDSAFVRVHDQNVIQAEKRLYMTATPRIYVEDSKAKAARDGILTYSMDEEDTYGPEFHHLGFGRAVEMGHLADYKVLILAVDEESVASSFQSLLAEDGDLNLDDVARIVGCWNGLSKRGVNGERLSITDTAPMHRAVAFARNIKESKATAAQFERVGRELVANHTGDDPALSLEAEHVDGTFNVLERSRRLGWLQDETGADTCRILTNAKCLSEGVDVPSLDAVLFLNPRNSQVDVVQSVGRVMRRSATTNKEYGYIILPIAVPASQDPETALNDNKKYKVVWDVLQALRAHDDRFDAMVNKIDLDRTANDRVDVIGIGTGGDNDGPNTGEGEKDAQGVLFSMRKAAEWENAIFARMVKKVGDRRYWEDWASNVKDIADRQTARIRALLDGKDPRPAGEFEVFLEGLRGNLNDGITRDDAVDMLVQHLITKPVFDALFTDHNFTAHNPVSQVMDSMLATLDAYHLDTETHSLEDFYRSVRIRAEGITDAVGKQKIITELYERFFKLAFPHVSESMGIVYTPIEVVDFILRAVNDILKKDFGAALTDEGVHVLDPFTGTGTFITRLIQSGLISPHDLARKYAHELHANEILLMAYYIAAINIEATFHTALEEAQGHVVEDFAPFEGVVLTDTFQMTEDDDTLDTKVFTNNNDRALEQNALDIRVIIGNPPYSAGQTSSNDNNANQSYPTLDESIRSTYVAHSTATSSRTSYDSYIRAIRWASNRILNSEHGGVVCYVSNGGYLDSNSADGLRLTLADEFHDIYIYNLRGNTRTSGEQARREGGQIFGSGSRATVAIMLLVKHPGPVEQCALHYKDIGDYLDRSTKLTTIADATLDTIGWETITPNEHGDWTDQRDPDYELYPAIAARGVREKVFYMYSNGLGTSRDAWVYNFSEAKALDNVKRTANSYNAELDRWTAAGRPEPARAFITTDATKISWSSSLTARFNKGKHIDSADTAAQASIYRPFNKVVLGRNEPLIHRPAILPKFFPDSGRGNIGFHLNIGGTKLPFCLLSLESVPDLNFFGQGGQFFPRYFCTEEGQSILLDESAAKDNITDWALTKYRETYGPQVSKDDIFYYVYGLLHSPEYRTRYEADLRKALPRIPQVPGRDRFEAFVATGRRLTELHIGYEDLAPHPLVEATSPNAPEDPYERYAVVKMKYGGKAGAWDKTTITYNSHVTLSGIPVEAQEYMLGSRSALDWILERYQVKTDKASGIVNDPNDWSREHHQPRYIIDLIGRITTLSLETTKLVNSLPDLDLG